MYAKDCFALGRGPARPAAMEYSLRSNCLATLYVGPSIHQSFAAYASALTVLDLAAGGRMLCRLHEAMCALQSPCLDHSLQARSVGHTGDALCREDNTITAFTLLDRGSGNEVVTGSVRYGVFVTANLSLLRVTYCSKSLQGQVLGEHGSIAGSCHQGCQLSPRSLCPHKPHSHTATLNMLDFRTTEKWVAPSAHACDMAKFCWLMLMSLCARTAAPG